MPRLSKKTDPAVGANYNRSEAEDLASNLVALQLKREGIIAERDAEIERVSEPFAGRLDLIDQRLNSGLNALENWAENHLEEFARSESVLLAGHRCGWRLGNHKTKLLSRWTWKKVLEALENLPKRLRDRWIRVTESANKEAMIEDREKEEESLRQIGVKIIQDRSFYLDPAREGQPEKTLRK